MLNKINHQKKCMEVYSYFTASLFYTLYQVEVAQVKAKYTALTDNICVQQNQDSIKKEKNNRY
jgi:hypothetical protein